MRVQLPYNPHPPGAAPIPVWPPPYNTWPSTGPQIAYPFAIVTWKPLGSPQSLIHPSLLQNFHLFEKLPPELRLRIWTLAAPGRVLELRSWGSGRYYPVKISVHPHRLPSLFRTCHESRTVALRIYLPILIGVSYAVRDPNRSYVDWKYHPTNPAADPRFTVGTAPLPYTEPCRPQMVRVSWESDIFYFGPDFQREHLWRFFRGEGEGMELRGLQRVAFCRNLWCGREEERDGVRDSLWRLKERDVQEVIMVPDDDKGPLIDRWYYGKHDIDLLEPEWAYTFRPSGVGVDGKTVMENLEDWFERLWRPDIDLKPSGPDRKDTTRGVGTQLKEKEQTLSPKTPPTVTVKSIRRNGRRMSAFEDGLWDIQKEMGDMRVWAMWAPPPERS